MAKKKRLSNDLKYEFVQGPEITKEDLNAIANILAKMIYDQIMKERQTLSDQNPNKNNNQPASTIKNE